MTIQLPYATQVVVQGFVNAKYVQRVTIEPQGMPSKTLQGEGLYDTPIGSFVLQTPQGEGDSFPVTVTVAHSRDGGTTWQPSEVDWANCIVAYYGLATVVSEDSTDDTWDDATTYFSWTLAPA